MIKHLIILTVKRPYILDLFIALIALPIFCHLVVTTYESRPDSQLFALSSYRLAMCISYLCGLVVMAYIRISNHFLNKNYGIDDDWDYRAVHQVKWNILPPLLFVVAAIAGYYAYFDQNIIKRGYFSR